MNAGAQRTLALSWLLLIHQLPAKPAYLRVKIWRRLQNIGAIWQRAGRFRAEREATEKILEIRSGRVPSPVSQCSDGMWIVTPGHIRFSKKIDGPIPLAY